MNVTLHHYLILSVTLFAIGIVGVATRRNMLIIIMSFFLIFDSVSIVFMAFSRWDLLPEGKVFALFVLGFKAVWILLGLALVFLLYRDLKTIFVDDVDIIKG